MIDNKRYEEEANKIIIAINNIYVNHKDKDFTYKSLEKILGSNKDKIKNKNLDKLLNKLYKFYRDITTNIDKNNQFIENEYLFISEVGWHCIYVSLILREIAKRKFNINLKMYQGIFFFEHTPDIHWIFGEVGTGFHSWCMYKDSVLDLTFLHQQDKFLVKPCNDEYINGAIPRGVTYKGELMSDEIIDKYMKDILSVNKLSIDDWILNIENYISRYN